MNQLQTLLNLQTLTLHCLRHKKKNIGTHTSQVQRTSTGPNPVVSPPNDTNQPPKGQDLHIDQRTNGQNDRDSESGSSSAEKNRDDDNNDDNKDDNGVKSLKRYKIRTSKNKK